jgi:hypothetical protein
MIVDESIHIHVLAVGSGEGDFASLLVGVVKVLLPNVEVCIGPLDTDLL